MVINNNLTLGIDLGIGSCGWAVIRGSEAGGEIVGLGVWMFDVPETYKNKKRTPTNQLRQQHRGLRKVFRRRRQRMKAVRALFAERGLIEGHGPQSLWVKDQDSGKLLDPWKLRAEGLDRRLSGAELAVALGHIAKHRGFKSNSKRDRGANAAKDSSKMLKAIEGTREKLATWRTVGEMFARDEAYARRKRNRDGDYTRSILRDDQEREVRLLLDRQRRLGNVAASSDLETAFIETAFFQRPLQDSEHLVGPCPFEPGERRAARRSPSFERFRFLSRLTTLRLSIGREERALSPAEIAKIEAEFGRQKRVSFKTLRNVLRLDDSVRFANVSVEDEKNDFVARSGNAAEGTATLRATITEAAGDLAWLSLLNTPETLDTIADILTFRDDLGSIRVALHQLGLESAVFEALVAAVEDGRAVQAFKGAGHISAKACRAIIPHLRRGLVYSAACEKAGYDHSARPATRIEDINNPVARKALSEALKQVKALVREFGLPRAIHVELARDVGKSGEERDEIKFGIEKRNKQKDRLRAEFESVVGHPPAGAEDLLRYELWKEQKGRCLYTDNEIHPNAIVATDNTVQVDHILPWSRSGDDSFVNKTLCYARANQEKKGCTPFEWLKNDEERWTKFEATIQSIKEMKGRKKRNYLLKDATILETKFRPRNLNDTRYACRLLADELKRLYPDDGARHVFARPGALTDRLRKAWGLQDLKKGPDGKRIADDRHHALDALVVAATSESALQELTRAFQDAETRGLHRDFKSLSPPWPGFVEEARGKLQAVFVSRSERRRARGEGHAATIRRVVDSQRGALVYERKSIEALTHADLDRIKDPDRNAKLVDAIRRWMDAGKPKDRHPLSPKGDPIRKVSLATNKKVDVLVREGAADRGEMTRVDVFRKKNKRGKWQQFLVPIYPHQIFDRVDWPVAPNRAVAAHKAESGWPVVGPEFEFLFSLYPMCFVELVTVNGESYSGYFREMNRNDAGLTLSEHHSKDAKTPKLGSKTLASIRKFAVDRLGRRFEIEREIRTWRGAACT